MTEDPEPRGSVGEAMRKVGPLLSLGLNFAVSVGIGTAAGYWLDRRFKTSPWLLLGGMALGLVAAFVGFFKVVMPSKDGKS